MTTVSLVAGVTSFAVLLCMSGCQHEPLRHSANSGVVEEHFGVTVADAYRWLEKEDGQEVRDWIDSHVIKSRAYLDGLSGRTELRKRYNDLYHFDSMSAPIHRGNRFFYVRSHRDKEKSIVYWRDDLTGPEHLLIDPNTFSSDGSISLGTWVPSESGKKMAYMVKKNNSDESTIRVLDVTTGKESAIDVIDGVRYSNISWALSDAGFYYTYYPNPSGVPVVERNGLAEIRFHRLETSPASDSVIFPAIHDSKKLPFAYASRDGRWLFVKVDRGSGVNDLYYRSIEDTAFTPFVTGRDSATSVQAWKNYFYIVTNDGSPNRMVYRTRLNQPQRKFWQPLVKEKQTAVLESFEILGNHLALRYLERATNLLEIKTLSGRHIRRVKLPGVGVSGFYGGREDEDMAFYSYSSFTVPYRLYKTSVANGKSSLFFEARLPVDSKPYKVQQIWYKSKDGTRVSMFLVHRRKIALDQSTPFLLYGYGGFNSNMLPNFRSQIYPWLEAGGGYALPNIRGGGEYGEDWHRAGKLERKQNTFDDFIAAAEYLIEKGYTSPQRLVISGASNGGLLVGAMITQRPDLFRAAICGAPLLDMLRYHLFGPAKFWISEYGSPDDATQFKTLYQYSPYHHVRSGVSYPSVLFMSARNDDRVAPLHARKMVAALEAATNGSTPILFRVEENAGHAGGDMRKKSVEASVDEMSFLMHQTFEKKIGEAAVQ